MVPRSGSGSRNSGDLLQSASALDASYQLNQFGETVNLRSVDGSDTGLSLSLDQSQDEEMPSSIGRYKITSVLGAGGFGAVYRGRDEELAREVAIKVPLLGKENSTQEDFLKEARRLAQLTHPGIVSVFDVGVEDDRCYIVTEFLAGQDLNEWVAANPLTWQTALPIVADALAHAHSTGTIHRDVKPANIIMVERHNGISPVLVGFGRGVGG